MERTLLNRSTSMVSTGSTGWLVTQTPGARGQVGLKRLLIIKLVDVMKLQQSHSKP